MNKFKQKFTSYVKGQGFSATVLTAIIIAAVVFVNILIYTLSTVYPLYISSPEKQDFSISDASDALFKKHEEKGNRITITFCSYEDAVASHYMGVNVLKTAKELEKNYPDLISIRFINAITKLDSEGKSVVDDLKTYSDGGKTAIDGTSVVISSDTRFRVMPSYNGNGYADFYTLDAASQVSSYNGEESFVSSIMWTLSDQHGVAYITVGHGETATPSLHKILTAAGYEVKDINLRKNDIPEDAELVVISNPTADFEKGTGNISTEHSRLIDYKEKGGNFFITLNPFVKKLPVLESFVADFGVSFYTVESGEKAIIKDSHNGIMTDGFTLIAEYANTSYANNMKQKITDSTGDKDASVVMRNVAAFQLDSSKNAYPILSASSSAVCEAEGNTVNTDGNYTIAACAVAKNDFAGDSKLFVMSDGMMTSGDAVVSNGYSNKDFLYSIFDVFYGKGEMPYGCNSLIYNTMILENLTMSSAKIYTAVILAVPAIVAICGAILLRRRKNR